MFKIHNYPTNIYPDLVRIETIGDGSCFFHAVVQSIFDEYKNSPDNIRMLLVSKLRSQLADLLPEHYPTLSRGTLEEISKELPEYSLENMQKELSSSSPVDYIYTEFISNILSVDIYILDYKTEKLWTYGKNDQTIHKNRNSLVLGYTTGHYETVGLKLNMVSDTEYKVQTVFPPDHELILVIKNL